MKNLFTLTVTLFLISGCTKGLIIDPKNEASASTGRFQLVKLNETRKDQFIFDSSTGKIWRMNCAQTLKNECTEYGWKIEQPEDLRL